MSIEITQVKETALNEFVNVAYILNKNNKFWVPELKKSVKQLLHLSHPFWKNAKRKLFIAHRNGKPQGAIAAIINHAHNKYHNEKCGFFGFFETVDDKEVSSKLLTSACNYLKEEGMSFVRGPMNPSTNYTCGMLISSFDAYPQIMMPYNADYYNQHVTDFGFTKVKDLYAFIRFSTIPISERIEKIIGRVLKNIDVSVRNINLGNLPEEMQTVREIYNQAWSQNWGFVPIATEEMADTAKNIKPILNPKVTCVLEVGGKPAAFGIIVPDVNTALKKINGKITVFNFLPFLMNMRKISQGRLLLLGVREQYRNKGLELLMIKQLILSIRKLGWSYGEISWILEDNDKIISIIKEYGGRLYKKYRIYEKKL